LPCAKKKVGVKLEVKFEMASSSSSSSCSGSDANGLPNCNQIPPKVQEYAFEKKNDSVVEDGEWVVVRSERGSTDLVKAAVNGRGQVQTFSCLTGMIVGQPYGTCFDAKLLEGAAREEAMERTVFGKRFENEKELLYDENGLLLRKSKKRKLSDSNPELDRSKWALYDLVVTKTIGTTPKPSSDELETRRNLLLKALNSIEEQLGLVEKTSAVPKTNKNNVDSNDGKKEGEGDEWDPTHFGRAKSKKRKTDRSSKKFMILKVNAMTISESFWFKDALPSTFYGVLRPFDTIPRILSFSSVQPGSRVLILDELRGFLTGAILERMDGQGQLFVGHFNTGHVLIPILKCFNFSKKTLMSIREINLKSAIENESIETMVEKNDKKKMLLEQSITKWKQNLDKDEKIQQKLKHAEKNLASFGLAFQSRMESFKRDSEAIESFCSELFDSLVLVSKYDPRKVMPLLIPFLNWGCPFVVHAESAKVLLETKQILQDHAVEMSVSETFLRDFQVLPERTHPEVWMSSRSGFLLTGYKAAQFDDDCNEN